MVVKANKQADGIGGHLATFASSAALYEVGLQLVLAGQGRRAARRRRLHPGPRRARHLRPGLPRGPPRRGAARPLPPRDRRRPACRSYPHPRLMPDFWEYPTVSMGLGSDQRRSTRPASTATCTTASSTTPAETRVWCFVGDGETDEPETLGVDRPRRPRAARQPDLGRQLQPAAPRRPGARQRQDHPGARGGLPRRRLERHQGHLGLEVGRAAGQGRRRRAARQDEHHGRRRVPALRGRATAPTSATTSSGPIPGCGRWSSTSPTTSCAALPRGGHDYKKLYAAYRAATEQRGAPTVILAKTIKGWTLGPSVEARNATHQIKKMTMTQLRVAARAAVPRRRRSPRRRSPTTPSRRTTGPRKELRRAHLPDGAARRPSAARCPTRVDARPSALPAAARRRCSTSCCGGSGKQACRPPPPSPACCATLARDEGFGRRIVPIIPDEARTFGMDSLFKEFGIYAAAGPEVRAGRPRPAAHLHGVEARPAARGGHHRGRRRWRRGPRRPRPTPPVACPMVPFFIFYSMFGFQRVGDLIWQAADARARGFLLGATAGRTTLLGEGLQHQDGHSLRAGVDRAGVPGLRPRLRLRGGDHRPATASSACTAPSRRTSSTT